MARCQGTIARRMSGTLGSLTVGTDAHGVFLRPRTRPRRADTPHATRNRERFAHINRRFRDCTDHQLDAWADLGARMTAPRRLARHTPLTGQQAFAAVNGLRHALGLPATLQAPDRPDPPDAPANVRLEARHADPDGHGGQLRLHCDPVPPGVRLQLHAAPPLPPSRTYIADSKYRALAILDAPGPEGVDILALYTTRFGPPPPDTRIAVRLVPLSPHAFAGPPADARARTDAPPPAPTFTPPCQPGTLTPPTRRNNSMATERIYALFQDVADAERAIGALQDHGITRDHIGVVARRPAEQDEAGRVRTDYTRVSDAQVMHQGEPAVAYEARPGTLPPAALAPTLTPSSTADTAQNVDTVGKEGITFSTPQDAAAGAAVGGGIGLVTGLLAAAAALAIPGVGIVLSGGILAGALGAAAATTVAGAAVGGVAGYLTDMGMPQQAAQNVASRLTEGDYLVTVDADTSRYDELRQILFKYNAAGVDVNVAAAGETVPPAAVTVPAEALADVTPAFVDVAPAAHSVPASILAPDITPPAPSTALTAPVMSAPVVGEYELREAQLVEPRIAQPAVSAPPPADDATIALNAAPPPRVPADPALAQETEPMTAGVGTLTPSVGVTAAPASEVAHLERAHTGEGQDRE